MLIRDPFTNHYYTHINVTLNPRPYSRLYRSDAVEKKITFSCQWLELFEFSGIDVTLFPADYAACD